MDKVPDGVLLKKVNERLQRAGSGGTSRIIAAARSGTVTLTGTLQYEMQRRPMLKAANSCPGVMRVVDQMTVAPKKAMH